MSTEQLYDHDLGLSRDLPMLRRRRLLGLDGGTTVATLAATGPDLSASARPLTSSGIVRSDIRRGFGKAGGVARGVPLTINLQLVTASTGAAAAGLAVYLWHCDRDGRYSLYGNGLTTQNYLRGVQPSSSTGWVSFTSIFPAGHAGRRPHIHFEVYPSIGAAADVRNRLRTSRIALPADVCAQVYATSGYLAELDPGADAVVAEQTAVVTGSVTKGYTAAVTIGL